MGFFDQVTAKGAGAWQDLTNKTKNMGEIARVNAEIGEEERKINSYYTQLGQLYIKLYEGNYNEQLSEIVKAINDTNANLENLKKQLNALKGVTVCPHCHAEVASGNAFCIMCGKPVNGPDEHINCPSCGAAVVKGNKFCTLCGFRLPDASAPAPSEASAPVFIPTPVPMTAPPSSIPAPVNPQPVDMDASSPACAPAHIPMDIPAPAPASDAKFCPACGKSIDSGSAFCVYCGAKQ